MKKLFVTLLSVISVVTSFAQAYDQKVENMRNPLVISTVEPRFSWRSESPQRAWRIVAGSEPGASDLWDSGMVKGEESTWIPWGGRPLRSGQRVWWTVTVTNEKGKTFTTEPQEFGIGLLKESQWGGRWIGLNRERRCELRPVLPARRVRKEFRLEGKPVKRATAYVSGLGLYRLWVNGQEVGGTEVLKPAPTDYRKTVFYNAYDVTPLLADSTVAVGIETAPGRYYPPRQHKPSKIPVFGDPTCRLNLVIEYADGKRQKLSTDESWRITDLGPVRMANEYDGETYDARMETPGWTSTGFDDSAWMKAERSALPEGTLRGMPMPAMTASEGIDPVSIVTVGVEQIVDFGRNMAGWVSFIPKGEAGDTLTIRYAERLTPEGTLYTANLRDALSTDTYIASGKENGTRHAPSYTYHGFRYVAVKGNAEGLKAHDVGDPMEMTLDFECSNPVLNRVVANALRGIRANYKGMPVDCPQRNERQPWLGDRTAGALGESGFVDCERLYSKWVTDICEAQREDGCIPDVAPAFWNYYTDNVTWPAALPEVVDMLATRYGNTRPIEQAYPHMSRWVEHILDEYSKDGIVTRDRYGDWCVPPERPDMIHSEDPRRITDGSLISTAYMVRVLGLMERFAARLGLQQDAQRWSALKDKSAKAFAPRFLTEPDSLTATAAVLTLAFDLAPDSIKKRVEDRLVNAILTDAGGHICTGVIGTAWLMRTLSKIGRGDVAWLVATQDTYPSWGYMAAQGATTTWELWNGDTANPSMNSGNHVMLLGDLLTWVQTELGGIRDTDRPNHYIFRADLSIPDCEYVTMSRPTPLGTVTSSWRRELNRDFTWIVTLPHGAHGEVYMPDGTVKTVAGGTHTFSCKEPFADAHILDGGFLYTSAPFPQCHATTIVETKDGDLVGAYFGGTHERHPDVCIRVSRKPKGADTWEAPITAGDGVFTPGTPDAELAGVNDSTPGHRKACWNPVITEMPSGELWLFYKVGANVADWTGWLVKSRDGGRTWGPREALPKGFIGPVKNKPEIVDGRLICASSTEKGGWKLHFETLDLQTGQWTYTGPVDADSAYVTEDLLPDGTPREGARLRPIQCIQPSILRHRDGRLQVLMRTRNGRLATSWSHDRGLTWSRVELTDIPNNQSGTDAVTLDDGTHVLVYNPVATENGLKKGPRTPLAVATSTDGLHWTDRVTLEDSPISQYSYPCVIAAKDGSIITLYTWRRLRVGYRQIKL